MTTRAPFAQALHLAMQRFSGARDRRVEPHLRDEVVKR